MKCEKTLFLHKLFSFFSSSLPGKPQTLKFTEFVLFNAFFLTLTEQGIARYLFKLMTPPNTKGVLLRNIDEELEAFFGNSVEPRKIKQFLTKASGAGHTPKATGTIVTELDFIRAVENNKNIMFPLIAYQINMKNKTYRSNTWRVSKEGFGDSILSKIDEISADLNKLIAKGQGIQVTSTRDNNAHSDILLSEEPPVTESTRKPERVFFPDTK